MSIIKNRSHVCPDIWLKPSAFALQDPETGKPAILVSAQRMVRFEGMSHADSTDLLERVLAVGTDNSKVYRHEWQPNDFLLWANRKVIHTASIAEPWLAAEDKSRMFHLVFLDTKRPIHAAKER